jgi:hypothetical protein
LISAWLTQHGYDADHRDAVLRQIHLESRFVECPVDTSGGVGLHQWTGIRRKALREAAGVACPPWKAQMTFADKELVFTVLRRTFGQGRR